MNYYPHHIGDYARDTAHLTLLEHGAYRRMMDVAYATERPLPRDQQRIYRLVGARTKAEQLAVDVVLGEFWVESEEGWRNARIEEEIAKARAETEDARFRKENEAERQRRHRERRKALFEQLRELGEVPKWDTTTDELERMLATAQQRTSDAPVTRTATATHEPIPKSQEPRTKEKTTTIAPSASRLEAGGTNGHDLLGEKTDPIVERIPLCDGTEFGVPKTLRDELDRLYPAVDPDQTLREIRGWCIANPRRRKTVRGVKGFITSWFSREQDKQSRRPS